MPTLRSVAYQTFSNFECIVVDDGSDDGEQLASNVANLADSRFIYVRRSNGGGSAARNTGIERASGQFIAFLDSDDEFLPQKLEVTKSFIDHDPTCIYYSYAFVRRRPGGRMWIRPKRPINLNESVAEYLFCANQFIMTISLVLSSETAKAVRFDPELRRFQDPDFCVRLAWMGAKFKMIERPLVIWNDFDVEGRTSHKKSNAHESWLAKNGTNLSDKERYGFKAIYLANEWASAAPFRAIAALYKGLLLGGVPTKVIARQFLRSFLPDRFYRILVDRYVDNLGSPDYTSNASQDKAS
jgi:glycosyltransferase involved in cell wall biosynthesis